MSGRAVVRGMSGLGLLGMVCGAAVAPAHAGVSLLFSTPTVEFGAVVVDTSVERSVTLSNTGDTPFTPFRFDFSDFNSPVHVQIGKSTCARNVVIPAGGSCQLVLYAFPDSTAQALAGTLWVVDSTDTRAATLTIAGQVVAPPPAPDNPTKASRTVLSGNRSEVSWAKVAGATGYEVQSSGRVVCTAGARASSCVTKKAFGPRVGVWVTARNDFGVSDGVEAKYRAPDSPVTFAAVSFTGRSTTLRKSTRAHAADAGTALAKQGFSKDITVVAGTRSGRSVARVRAQTVQRLILDRYADFPDIDPPSLATAVRGAGNGVRITVE